MPYCRDYSSLSATIGSSNAICKTSLRFRSPPEKPSFKCRSAKARSMPSRSIHSARSRRTSRTLSSSKSDPRQQHRDCREYADQHQRKSRPRLSFFNQHIHRLHFEHCQMRINLGQLRLHRRCEVPRIPARSDRPSIRPPVTRKPVCQIILLATLLRQRHRPLVRHHADHLDKLRFRRPQPDQQPFPNCRFMRKRLFRQQLVDHQHIALRIVIRIRKGPTLDQPRFHRLEVTWQHDLAIRRLELRWIGLRLFLAPAQRIESPV